MNQALPDYPVCPDWTGELGCKIDARQGSDMQTRLLGCREHGGEYSVLRRNPRFATEDRFNL